MALHLNQTVHGRRFGTKILFSCESLVFDPAKMLWEKNPQKTSLNPSPLHHARQNHKKFPLLIKWAPQTRSHKALTYKELTPAKKTPASLTGMKGVENSKGLKRLDISWLYRHKTGPNAATDTPGSPNRWRCQFSLRKSSRMQVKAPPTSAVAFYPSTT